VAKLKEKRFREALEDFNQAIEFNPHHTGAYYNRGKTGASLRSYHLAIEDFDYLIISLPNHAAAFYYRGLCHGKLGNKQLVIEDFERAVNLCQQQGNGDMYQKAMNYLNRLQQ